MSILILVATCVVVVHFRHDVAPDKSASAEQSGAGRAAPSLWIGTAQTQWRPPTATPGDWPASSRPARLPQPGGMPGPYQFVTGQEPETIATPAGEGESPAIPTPYATEGIGPGAQSDPYGNGNVTGEEYAGGDAAVSGPAWNPNPESVGTTNQTYQFLSQQLSDVASTRLTNWPGQLMWSLDHAIAAALQHSFQIQAAQLQAVENLEDIGIEYGRFDAIGFMSHAFTRSNRPVGNNFEVNNNIARIRGEEANFTHGIRKELRNGGQLEVSQLLQLRDDNSGVLDPEDQARSTFSARWSKELLRGAGRSVAMNQVLVARHNASAVRAQSLANIADQIAQVSSAFWNVFAARAEMMVYRQSIQQAQRVLSELKARTTIDAEPSLILQTENTLFRRQSAYAAARGRMLQAQFELMRLINAPETMGQWKEIEIITHAEPDFRNYDINYDTRLNTAIHRRPEIGDFLAQIRSATAVNHTALNQLLPRLTWTLEASLDGLEGNRDLAGAFQNQFEASPTYQIGLDLEMPFANHSARFDKRKAEIALSRLQAQWKAVVQDVQADVFNTGQSMQGAQNQLQIQIQAFQAAQKNLYYLETRRLKAPKTTSNPSFDLQQLLQAQDVWSDTLIGVLSAYADRRQALFDLNRATGILVQSDLVPSHDHPAKPGMLYVYHRWVEEAPRFDEETHQLGKMVEIDAGPLQGRSAMLQDEAVPYDGVEQLGYTEQQAGWTDQQAGWEVPQAGATPTPSNGANGGYNPYSPFPKNGAFPNSSGAGGYPHGEGTPGGETESPWDSPPSPNPVAPQSPLPGMKSPLESSPDREAGRKWPLSWLHLRG